MAKVLKVAFPNRCIGCEMCVLEVQHQFKKVGLEGSLIRIFRTENDGKIEFKVDLDPQINTLDIAKIAEICPTAVFSIEEGETNELVS